MTVSLLTYRIVLFTLYGIGFAAATYYLVLYKAWRWRRWRSPDARDSSGLLVVLWAVYGWLIWRQVVAWAAGRGQVPRGADLWISLTIFAVIDGYFVQRLLRYIRVLRAERTRPMIVCPCCYGQGVVERQPERPPERPPERRDERRDA